ncbi:Thiolase-like protein [Pseudocohnilembus persalinus]|uniref:propanoyl-CoA C-acyltransferase n=1 Tax=Pseudocohnilembus persalinus TaxID=266149 RepID=A0A0V0QZQ8_PSEPJ|nr:Thiolase-like protein [Pseudocohnilembus persalinus]|eukprot:KRX07791.1 Thiolase-like protein [Pseudocohnilembus persalinus]
MQQKKQQNRVFVVGCGMTKFIKPGKPGNPDYPLMCKQAVSRALRDANLTFDSIEAAAVGFVYGDSTSGNRAIYESGLQGIPIYNVNNNCATGSTAIHMAHQMIAGGLKDCVLAAGFEKMEKGSLGQKFNDRTSPLDMIITQQSQLGDSYDPKLPFAPVIFGNAGIEHMKKYGTKEEHFHKIGYKNHLHSVNNPYSQFKDKYTLEQISKAPKVYGPLTKLCCCPTSDGAGAAIIVSEEFMKKHKLEDQAVEIKGISLTTDSQKTFNSKSLMNLAGFEMAQRAAKEAYQQAGITANDVGVVELHDCFAANELVTYEAIGLCPEGKAAEFIDSGNNTYGGKYVVNPSGGLISKGHPLGATGLAQLCELSWQLRGMAQKRQVPNLKYAFQHNLGLGGACVCVVYSKYNQNKGWSRPDQTSDPEILEKMEEQENLENKNKPQPRL